MGLFALEGAISDKQENKSVVIAIRCKHCGSIVTAQYFWIAIAAVILFGAVIWPIASVLDRFRLFHSSSTAVGVLLAVSLGYGWLLIFRFLLINFATFVRNE